MARELDPSQEITLDQQRALQLARWGEPIIPGTALLFLALYAFYPLPTLLLLSASLAALAWPPVHRARRLIAGGDLQQGMKFASAGLWIISLTLAMCVGRALAPATLVAVFPIVITAVYGTRRLLVATLLGAVAVCAVNSVFFVTGPAFGLEQLPPPVFETVVAAFTVVVAGLYAITFWHSNTRRGETFAQMQEANRALQESERSLERKVGERTAELAHKNEALERSQREVALARDEALAANRAKSSFLANMSHELRTPLNAIIGYSEMLQEEARDLGHEALVPDLEKILTAGRHLLSLINDVLDISKIEAGKMDVFTERFDVAEAVRSIATTVQPLVAQKANALETSDLAGVGSMRSDLTKVRQILFNLLSNAAKFTSGGTIRLSASRRSRNGVDWIDFQIADTGIGMSREQLEAVFEAFTQADASTSRDYGGTGLGLAITRRFCELLGGGIDATSEPGKGTEFRVQLPAECPERAAATGAPRRRERAVAPGDATMVLVIDDDATARDLMERFLAREGYGVISAAGGEEGLRLAREHRPDAITLDILMPGMDGWVVLSALKSDPQLAEIPVILLTIVDDQNLGFALGASEYLNKPVDRERLAAVLRKYASGRPPASVLVVEDDEPTRQLLCRMIEKAGWPVDEAENGRVALERVAEAPPGLILLDLVMPVMDGFAFIGELRRRAAWRSIPVVVVTAKELTPENRALLNGCVERVIEKGAYSREDLLDEVRDLVAARLRRLDGDRNGEEE